MLDGKDFVEMLGGIFGFVAEALLLQITCSIKGLMANY